MTFMTFISEYTAVVFRIEYGKRQEIVQVCELQGLSIQETLRKMRKGR